jgi:molybdopterin synthase catalytic subunit
MPLIASIVRPPLRYDGHVTDRAPPSARTLVRITSEPIVVDEALAFVADPGAGGTAVFIGTVRDHSGAGDVTGLSYEAWDDLAVERLGAIGAEMHERWPIRKVAIVHRTGDLAVGEASVVVAASAPHRGDAFDACRHGIERLKEDVPIWKKESLVTGDAHWVMGS